MPAVESGVDEFAERRRTALEDLREPQNCFVFPKRRGFPFSAEAGYNLANAILPWGLKNG
jgi:hypothetical protein